MKNQLLTTVFFMAALFCAAQKPLSNKDIEFDPNPSQIPFEPGRDIYDLLFQFPVGVGGGEYGIATDGQYIYTTKWNDSFFHKYEIDGNYIGPFSVPGVQNIRDLTYDGQYFYGSTISTTIYKMDFNNQTLVGTISAPQPVRAIAYDENADGFWISNNWTIPLRLINRQGIILSSIDAPLGAISGLAWENITDGSPYLWAYSHPSNYTSKNLLFKVNSNTGAVIEIFDVESMVSITEGRNSGGLVITNLVYQGKWAFLGLAQNDVIWALELASCAPYFLPLSENFDSVTPPELPECWSKIEIGEYAGVETSSEKSHSSPNSLAMVFWEGDHTLFISPRIVQNINDLRIKFKAFSSVFSYFGTSTIEVGTITNPENFETFEGIINIALSENSWGQYYAYFNSYTGNNKYIAFRYGIGGWGFNGELYIDDIIIELIPSCLEPVSLSSEQYSTNSALLTWDVQGNEIMWDIEWGISGFEQGNGNLIEGIVDNPYHIIDLEPGTTYDYYVRSNCGNGDISYWEGPHTFTTAFIPPYFQDFDETLELPPGWKGDFIVQANRGVDNSNALSQSFFMIFGGGGNTYSVTETPVFSLSTEIGYKIMFNYRFLIEDNIPYQPGEGMSLNIDISYDHGNTFSTIHSINQNNHLPSIDFALVEINITPTSDFAIIRIEHPDFSDLVEYYVDIDDFIITPSCNQPTNSGLIKAAYTLMTVANPTGGRWIWNENVVVTDTITSLLQGQVNDYDIPWCTSWACCDSPDYNGMSIARHTIEENERYRIRVTGGLSGGSYWTEGFIQIPEMWIVDSIVGSPGSVHEGAYINHQDNVVTYRCGLSYTGCDCSDCGRADFSIYLSLSDSISVNVIFLVRDQENQTIENFIVSFNGIHYGVSGGIITNLNRGAYNYVISKAGYLTKPGFVEIINQNVIVNVVLEKKPRFENLISLNIEQLNLETCFEEPIIFDISGGGIYCALHLPTAISMMLSGSEPGLLYQPYKNGTQAGLAVLGTGLPLIWDNLTEGEYTVIATNGFHFTPMNGSAVVIKSEPLPVSVSIIASDNNVQEGTPIFFTAIPENEGNNPAYQWYVNGDEAGANSPEFIYMPADNDQVKVILTSSEECVIGSPAVSNIITMTVHCTGVPLVRNIPNTTVSQGSNLCFDAIQTIIVAANEADFIIEDGGSVALIAGQKIVFKPFTKVYNGGYLHAYIGTVYCNMPENERIVAVQTYKEAIYKGSFFKIYPNPTEGIFTLEFTEVSGTDHISIEVYSILGAKIFSAELPYGKKHIMSLADELPGIYIIRVLKGRNIGVERIIKK